jgi:hypothetical protein
MLQTKPQQTEVDKKKKTTTIRWSNRPEVVVIGMRIVGRETACGICKFAEIVNREPTYLPTILSEVVICYQCRASDDIVCNDRSLQISNNPQIPSNKINRQHSQITQHILAALRTAQRCNRISPPVCRSSFIL